MDFSKSAFTLSDTIWYHLDHPYEITSSGKPAKVFSDDGLPTRWEFVAPHTQEFKSKTAAHLKRISQLGTLGKDKELQDVDDDVLVKKADDKMKLDAQYVADLAVGWENMQIDGKKADFDRAIALEILLRPAFISWLPASITRCLDDRSNFMKPAKGS